MAKKLIMTIGLPFSGKSTLAKEYAGQGYVLIERDALLDEIIKSEAFNRRVADLLSDNPGFSPEQEFGFRNQAAIELLDEKVKALVLESPEEKFIYDGTNVQRKVREGLLKMKDSGVEISGIFLDVPLEELEGRAARIFNDGGRLDKFNDQTPRTIGRFAAMLERPDESEGFDELKVLKFEEAREAAQEYSLPLR